MYTIDHSIEFLNQGTIVCKFASTEMEIDSITMLACGAYKSNASIKSAFVHEKEQIEFELNEKLQVAREERANSFSCPDQCRAVVSIYEQLSPGGDLIATDQSLTFEVTHESI